MDVCRAGDLIWAVWYVSVVPVNFNIRFDKVLLIVLLYIQWLLSARSPLKIWLILYIQNKILYFLSQSHNPENSVETMYNLVQMTGTAWIKSSPQNWRAWGLIISVTTGQKNWNLIGGWSLTWTTLSQKNFWIFYNLVNLFTAQNRLKLGPQLPTYFKN